MPTATSTPSSSPTPTRRRPLRWPCSGIQGTRLLGMEDVEDIGGALDANSSCALMIWENVWAERFAQSLRNADGILIANGRIPAALVEEVMAEVASA